VPRKRAVHLSERDSIAARIGMLQAINGTTFASLIPIAKAALGPAQAGPRPLTFSHAIIEFLQAEPSTSLFA
jgi:hypothetical protein